MTKQEMNTIILDKLDNLIDDLFSDMHRDFNTQSGDITPQQMHELNDAIFKVSKLMTEQIYQNL